MDTILLIGATIVSGFVVLILRRKSHPSNPCPRDADGYHIPGIGGGVVHFGTDSPARHARDTITRITEVK